MNNRKQLLKHPKMEATFVSWLRKLLDTGRRNRLINYKVTKARSLSANVLDPTYFYEQLTNSADKSFTLKLIELKDGEIPTFKITNKSEIVVYQPKGGLPENALRKLERDAISAKMEKGVWPLFMSFGMLKWSDPADESTSIKSPLFLVPIEFRRTSLSAPFKVYQAPFEPVFNPALEALFDNEFDIDLYSIQDIGFDMDALESKFSQLIPKKIKWEILDESVIDFFVSYNEAMYHDLKINKIEILTHPVIQAVVLGAEAPSVSSTSENFDVNEMNVDSLYPAEDLTLACEADGSQRVAIAALKEGHSLIVDGPPGTGKSQTIANMITTLISDGKSVLFVCSKEAALQVVYDRLSETGLNEYVLPMYSNQLTRRKFAAMLGSSLRKATADSVISKEELERFKVLETQLEKFDEVINKQRSQIGMRLQSLIGIYSQIENIKFDVKDLLLEDISFNYYEVQKMIDEISQNWMNQLEGSELVWQGLIFGKESIKKRDVIVSTVKNFEQFYFELKHFARNFENALQNEQIVNPNVALSLLDLWFKLRNEFDNNVPENILSLEGVKTILQFADELEQFAKNFSSTPIEYLQNETQLIPLSKMLNQNIEYYAKQINDNFTADHKKSFFNDQNNLIAKLQTFILNIENFEQFNKKWSAKPDCILREVEDVFKRIAETNNQVLQMIFSQAGEELVENYLNKNKLEVMIQRDESYRYAFKPEFYSNDLEKIKSDYFNNSGFLSIFSKDKKNAKKILSNNLQIKLSDDEKLLYLESLITYKNDVIQWHTDLTKNNIINSPTEQLAYSFFQFKEDLEKYQSISTSLNENQISGSAYTEAYKTSPVEVLNEIRENYENIKSIQKSIENIFSTSKKTQIINLFDLYESSNFVNDVLNQMNLFLDFILDCPIKIQTATEHDQEKLNEELLNVNALIENWNTNCVSYQEYFSKSIVGFEIDLLDIASKVEIAKNLKKIFNEIKPQDSKQSFISCFMDENNKDLLTSGGSLEFQKIVNLFDEKNKSRIKAEIYDDFSNGFEFLTELLSPKRSIEIDDWSRYCANLEYFKDSKLEPILEIALQGTSSKEEFRSRLLKQFQYSYISTILNQELGENFNWELIDRAQIVNEFKALDAKLQKHTISKSINACTSLRPGAIQGGMRIIQTEANKKTKHMPIRELLDKCQNEVKQIKPCFMASPLNVVEHIPRIYQFDTVIFDEASQLNTEEAVAVISRAKQVVVAGDQKQLPPTNFFKKSIEDDSDEYVEEEPDAYESLLDAMKGSGHFLNKTLNWHYRSRHEDLIRFSNQEFYQNRLITFPSAIAFSPYLGVEHVKVNGAYDRGGSKTNIVEAQEVVRRVSEYALNYPEKSVGVVCLSSVQEELVRTELERVPKLSKRIGLNIDTDSKLFVKSLENVQGDESDIIIISVGYGPDQNKKFTMNFGPLNYNGGTRRLNVAITRARFKLDIITSFEPSEIKSDNISLLTFKRYLSFANTHKIEENFVNNEIENLDTDSPFEDDVRSVISDLGYEVIPQVGASGYRIDLGVKDINDTDKFMLGVECDGATYHSSRVARDRDRLRQEVLEGLGWRIYRIWSTSWFRNRSFQIEKLKEELYKVSKGHKTDNNVTETQSLQIQVDELEEYPKFTKDYLLFSQSISNKESTEIGNNIFEYDSKIKLQITSKTEDVIYRIVEYEGPIHLETLNQRIKAISGSRLTAYVKKEIEKTVQKLVNMKEIYATGNFYTVFQNIEQIPARTNYYYGEKVREIEHTPIQEMIWLLDEINKLDTNCDKNEKLKWVASNFGIKRLSLENEMKLQKLIDKANQALQKNKI